MVIILKELVITENIKNYTSLLDEFNKYAEKVTQEMDKFYNELENESELEELTKERITQINGKAYEITEKWDYIENLFERITYLKENGKIDLREIDKKEGTRLHVKEEMMDREYLLMDIILDKIDEILRNFYIPYEIKEPYILLENDEKYNMLYV